MNVKFKFDKVRGVPSPCGALLCHYKHATHAVQLHALCFQKCNERSLHLAMPYFVASILFASLPRLAAISTVWAFVALCVVVACVQTAYMKSFTAAVLEPVPLQVSWPQLAP
eukprot:scaffold86315_cov18-Tisochrysis_lutea.AAC.2